MSAHNPDNVSRHQGFYTPKESEQAQAIECESEKVRRILYLYRGQVSDGHIDAILFEVDSQAQKIQELQGKVDYLNCAIENSDDERAKTIAEQEKRIAELEKYANEHTCSLDNKAGKI